VYRLAYAAEQKPVGNGWLSWLLMAVMLAAFAALAFSLWLESSASSEAGAMQVEIQSTPCTGNNEMGCDCIYSVEQGQVLCYEVLDK
jgi:hypothetical protein